MTVHTAIRVNAQDHEQIKQLAKQHGLSYAQLLVDSTLGRLPEHRSQLAERLEEHEQRLQRLEQFAF